MIDDLLIKNKFRSYRLLDIFHITVKICDNWIHFMKLWNFGEINSAKKLLNISFCFPKRKVKSLHEHSFGKTFCHSAEESLNLLLFMKLCREMKLHFVLNDIHFLRGCYRKHRKITCRNLRLCDKLSTVRQKFCQSEWSVIHNFLWEMPILNGKKYWGILEFENGLTRDVSMEWYEL